MSSRNSRVCFRHGCGRVQASGEQIAVGLIGLWKGCLVGFRCSLFEVHIRSSATLMDEWRINIAGRRYGMMQAFTECEQRLSNDTAVGGCV